MASQELELMKQTNANTTVLSSRPGGNVHDPNKPDFESAAYTAMKPGWGLMEDTFGGTDKMREKATHYLPQLPLEHPDDYKQRVKATEFFNCVARTVRGLTGMVFRRPPKLGDDVNPTVADQWENIDGTGTNGEVFTREAFEEGLLLGHGAFFVDFPNVPAGALPTLADERASDIRPYWVALNAEQIISWRTRTKFGKTQLQQIVIRETTVEPKGMFGEQNVERFRVLYLGDSFDEVTASVITKVNWEVWEWVEREGKRSLERMGFGELKTFAGKPMTRIPVTAYFGGRKCDWFASEPPLKDLAYANVAHWNVLSDHRHSLHKASIPLLCFIGLGEDQTIEVGANAGITIPLGGDMKYVEHAGTALSATDKEIAEIQNRMAALGLAMLQQDTRAQETATAKRIDKADQDSALASSARSLQDAIEEAISFHMEYIGADPEAPGSVLVNRDFEDLTLDSATIQAFSNLHLAGQIDLDTLWSMLEEGNTLPEDFDREAVRSAIATEEAAKAAQALVVAQATAADPNAPPFGGSDTPPPDTTTPKKPDTSGVPFGGNK